MKAEKRIKAAGDAIEGLLAVYAWLKDRPGPRLPPGGHEDAAPFALLRSTTHSAINGPNTPQSSTRRWKTEDKSSKENLSLLKSFNFFFFFLVLSVLEFGVVPWYFTYPFNHCIVEFFFFFRQFEPWLIIGPTHCTTPKPLVTEGSLNVVSRFLWLCW